jgi:hypothetical protein
MLHGSAEPTTELDFETTIPEQVRGLPPYRGKVSWEALALALDEMTGPPRQKRQLARDYKDLVRKHGLSILMPRLRMSYCAARLRLGDFSDYWGWEFRGAHNPDESRSWAANMYWSETWMAKWGGGTIKRLLVLAEQGIGDEVFFASILPECLLRAQEVIYECDPRLHGLLSHAWPRLQCRPYREFEDRRFDYGPIDAFIPAGELMRMFRRARGHFPGKAYLTPNPERVAEFERFRGRTGISWRGRQGSVEPSAFGIDNPVSLQYGEGSEGIEHPGIDLKNDIEGVVALCSVLERVVTVPTSVQHFAGAVGSQVEIIVPDNVATQIHWDYPSSPTGNPLPWYPDARVWDSLDHWRQSHADQADQDPESRAA